MCGRVDLNVPGKMQNGVEELRVIVSCVNAAELKAAGLVYTYLFCEYMP